VIVEILSDTDSWSELMQKVDQYCKNGSAYVIAIDPYRNRVEVRGEAPPGLEIDIAAIVNA
jgi:Uma2 family endonuclease